MSHIVLLSNDYADRAAARGACAPAVAWMRKARHMSLRAMWNACPHVGWLAWICCAASVPNLPGEYRLAICTCPICDGYAAGIRGDYQWCCVEPFLRRWLGLPVRK